MKEDIAFNPARICCFGTQAVMLEPQPIPDAVQQFWCLGRGKGYGKIIGHLEHKSGKKSMNIQYVSTASEIIGQSNKLLLVELTAIPRYASQIETRLDDSSGRNLRIDSKKRKQLLRNILSQAFKQRLTMLSSLSTR